MRIVQLSDIHLSSENIKELSNIYLSSLIKDLKKFHDTKTIDIILLTGDLVDKGGASFKIDPYKIFKQSFIDPIIEALNLKSSQILFIPGNHDTDREGIIKESEYYLSKELTEKLANETLDEQRNEIQNSNKRIEKYKIFEKEFHKDTPNYDFSFNESLAIYESGQYKIGFALINDSWRCSPKLTREQHYIGINQLFNARAYFIKNKTDINIVVFHHPLDAINSSEHDSIDNILKSTDFDLAFFGHTHQYKHESITSSNGGIVTIRSRSAFNNYNELQSKYQPGYNILDLDIQNKNYTIYARKFIIEGFRFDKDVDSFDNGQFSGQLAKSTYVSINRNSNPHDIDLPSGYKADVDTIVKLLIGKSLYPDQYTFVRELIQNSVDACNRAKDKNNGLSPKITVHINSEENSFEILDEGDGMSKKIIREHFSVIGKSISQEFIDSNNNVNLISQFGIGFISTFITAQKIIIKTKSENDDLISFSIEDVFKGFNYTSEISQKSPEVDKTGTSIKVYLKNDFSATNAYNQIIHYCRHISNFSFFYNGVTQNTSDSWNLENGIFYYVIKNSKYECKLTVSNNSRPLISSNSGFLISNNSPQILPFLFPYIIGGEVVFEPKAIDLDLSRTNIINSQKSIEFKREMSVSLRKLFRDVIESDNEPLKSNVLCYLQFYLINYDNINNMIRESYLDFYSKGELIKLCSDLIVLAYDNRAKPISEILIILKSKNINRVYFHNGSHSSDLKLIVATYVQGLGNVVVYNQNFNVQFREGNQQFSMLQCIEIIVKSAGFEFIEIDQVLSIEMSNIIINKQEIPEKILDVIIQIENKANITLEISHLGAHYNKYLNMGTKYLLNYDNSAMFNILSDKRNLSKEYVEIYLLGVLGIDLVFSSYNPVGQ